MIINELKIQVRLQTLIKKIKHGKYVSMRDLESILGKDGVAEYRHRWDCEMSMRPDPQNTPFGFRRYIRLLHKADFARMKRRYTDEASLCESAIEELEELLHFHPSFDFWLDRSAVFEGADVIDPNVESMPRLTTSKSIWNKNPRPLKKQEVMLHVFESALGDLGHRKISDRKAGATKHP